MKSGNFVILENKKFEILNFNGEKIKHEITKVSKEFGDAYKGDYAHFTLKEIYEQPDLISKAGDRTIIVIIITQLALISVTPGIYQTVSLQAQNVECRCPLAQGLSFKALTKGQSSRYQHNSSA